MPEFEQKKSRRAFLKGSAATVVGVTGSAALSKSGDPLITETQEWASMTGVGVDETPYGLPISFESDVVRRNVEWLTASPDLFYQFHTDTCFGWNNYSARMCF